MNELRPRFSPISTDSSRKRAPCSLSLRKAETGVSRSAGISRTVAFSSSLIEVIRLQSVSGQQKNPPGQGLVLANLRKKDRCRPASAGPVPKISGREALHEAPDCIGGEAEVKNESRPVRAPGFSASCTSENFRRPPGDDLLTAPPRVPRIPAMPERPPPAYPLRFKEIYKDKIWGGPELAKVLGKKGAGRKCGESWEI